MATTLSEKEIEKTLQEQYGIELKKLGDLAENA